MLPNWTHNDIEINGHAIHYYRTGLGQEGKPSLVLLHGFSDNGLCWLPVARDLQEEWDVILPDAHAHGLSARLQPGERLDMVADVVGLIQALELDRPVVGGHSMGANIAAQVEAHYPGLARALILEDPPWFEPQAAPSTGEQEPQKPPMNAFAEWLMGLAGKTVEEVMEKGRADNPTWPEIEMRPWAESKLQFDTGFFLARGDWPEWTDIARSIHCPALLITADPEKGAIVTPQTASQAAGLSRSIQVIQIPGAGHNIRRENYTTYMEAVKGFLRTLQT